MNFPLGKPAAIGELYHYTADLAIAEEAHSFILAIVIKASPYKASLYRSLLSNIGPSPWENQPLPVSFTKPDLAVTVEDFSP
jgi:hypothetical protein